MFNGTKVLTRSYNVDMVDIDISNCDNKVNAWEST